MTSSSETVGFVGLGRMGTPMVTRLSDAGYRVVGFDSSPTAGSALAGARGFSRAAALSDLSGVHVVILMLPTSDVVEAVVKELLEVLVLRDVVAVIDMSSSEPRRTRALAARLGALGLALLDAPVSGGVAGAERGALTIMVGGDEVSFSRVLRLLEVLGSRVKHVGDSGAGHAVKAINNLMSATHLLASSEALASAREFGLDLVTVLDVVNSSSGRSGSTEVKWPQFVIPATYNSGFGLGLMVKDMRIACALGESVGTDMTLSECALRIWERAERELPAGADHTQIAQWLQSHDEQSRRGRDYDGA